MLKFPTTTSECHVLLRKLLTEAIGGDEVVEILIDHHVERMNQRELSAKYEMPQATVHRRIAKAHIKLRQLGLMPPEWEKTSSRHEASSSTDKA